MSLRLPGPMEKRAALTGLPAPQTRFPATGIGKELQQVAQIIQARSATRPFIAPSAPQRRYSLAAKGATARFIAMQPAAGKRIRSPDD